MRALQFSEFGPVSNLHLVELPEPVADSVTAIVKVAAASITPSDVKNVEGKIEHTTLPRVPGRDYAGTVVAGPNEWIGAEVWGTGGEIGYSIDGSHAPAAIDDFFVLESKPLEDMVRSVTKHGADVVFDSVGGPMFEPGLKALAHRGRQLEIASTLDRSVSFDLLDFYHNENQLFGVDTRARDAAASASLLEGLVPFFEQNTFRPPSIDRVVALADGRTAYEEVDRGQGHRRIVLVP
jgi:NADPH:quinone reductase-like Zn-dependent oxidoreductase